MGRIPRTALIALVAATVLAGCGGGAEETAEVPPEVAEQATEQVQAAADFCEAAQANIDAGAALTEFANAGEPPRPAEEIEAVLEPVRESNEQLVAAAPEEAKADVEQIAQVAELRMAAYEASAGDPAAANQDPAYVEAAKAAEEPIARFQQFLRARCRIDVS